jgi:hypothetical protein
VAVAEDSRHGAGCTHRVTHPHANSALHSFSAHALPRHPSHLSISPSGQTGCRGKASVWRAVLHFGMMPVAGVCLEVARVVVRDRCSVRSDVRFKVLVLTTMPRERVSAIRNRQPHQVQCRATYINVREHHKRGTHAFTGGDISLWWQQAPRPKRMCSPERRWF